MRISSSVLARFLVFLSVFGCGDDDVLVPDAEVRQDGGTDTGTTDSGIDASVPEGATFPAAPVDPDMLARAAVVFASCVPDHSLVNFLEDIYYEPNTEDVAFFAPGAFACLAAAADGCASIRTCLGIEFDLLGPCEPSCTGETLTVCDDAWRFATDCTRVGRTCNAAERACVETAAPLCDSASFVRVCREGVPIDCIDGREFSGFRCADYGLACSAPSDYRGCAGTGAACKQVGSGLTLIPAEGIRCTDDGTLEACVNDAEHSIECADIVPGFTCQTMGDAAFCGLGEACDPRARTVVCDGNTIVFCNAGVEARIDCTSLGFTGCSTEGSARAYCAPSAWLPG